MVWEERWHPLRREWVVISSHRNDRPWLGRNGGRGTRRRRAVRPDLLPLPGQHARVGTAQSRLSGVFVFDNDHPCVGPACAGDAELRAGLLPEPSRRRVVARRLLHAATRSDARRAAAARDRAAARRAFATSIASSAARPEVRHVLDVREQGRGRRRQQSASTLRRSTRRTSSSARSRSRPRRRRSTSRSTDASLFRDIIAAEEADGRRIVASQQRSALSFVPYFARYPYETYVAPRATHASVAELVRRTSWTTSPRCSARRSFAWTICGACRSRT